MRRGLEGLAINCRLPGVTRGRPDAKSRTYRFGLIKAALRTFERRVVNGMY